MDNFWHFQLTFVHSECKRSSLRIAMLNETFSVIFKHRAFYLVTGNVWYNCSKEGDIGLAQESFHSFTDPASVEVFLIVHVVMHFIWLLSLVTLFCRSKKWTVIWVLSTLMIILYGAVVGCLFAIEIYDAVVSFLLTHCSKSSFFVLKFNFDFPRKMSILFG